MRKILLLVSLLIIASVLISCASQQPAQQGQQQATTPTASSTTHTVDIQSFAFNPSDLTIKVGDTVAWQNLDSVAHTVTSDTGAELDSELLQKQGTYTHTFTAAGAYDYHCAPHPSMRGRITVE